MNDRNIEYALDESFEISDDSLDKSFEMSDNDFLDPDYCVEQKYKDDSLDGIDMLWSEPDDSILIKNNIDFAEDR